MEVLALAFVNADNISVETKPSPALDSFNRGVVVVEYTDAKQEVLNVVSEIEASYDVWKPLQTAADERAYDLLDRIYEEGARIDGDDEKRMFLVDLLRCHDEVKASKKWSPAGKRASELLVTHLLGLKTNRSRKHNWLSSLAYAAESEVEPVRGEFRKWISSKEVGGIDRAAEAYRGDMIHPGGVKLEEIAASLVAQIESPESVQLRIAKSAPAGLAVAVLQRKDDDNAIILRKETKEPQVWKVLTGLGVIPKPKKRRNEVQLRNIERTTLRTLTRIVRKLFDGGKPSTKDCTQFQGAVDRLRKVPELREKFFDGKPFVKTSNDSLGVSEIKPLNLEFHQLDPGRYIGKAREQKLIPYPFDPMDDAANKRELEAYLESLKQPQKVTPERSANPRTIEDAFVDDNSSAAEAIDEKPDDTSNTSDAAAVAHRPDDGDGDGPGVAVADENVS